MRDRFFARLSQWATERPGTLLVVAAVITIAALIAGSRLEVSTSWEDLLPSNDPSAEEFERIIDQYESTSSIILVIEGETEKIKAFAETIAGQVESLPHIKRVMYKADVDFLRQHALMLAKRQDLENLEEMFSNLDLTGFLTGLNDNFEKTYIYSDDEERLSNKEKTDEAIRGIDGVKWWLDTMKLYYDGKGSPEIAREAVDRMVIGDPYFLSYRRNMLMMIAQPNFPLTGEMEKILSTINGIREIIAKTKADFPGIEVGITGDVTIQAEEYESIMGGMWWTTIIAFFVIIAIFIIAFRMIVAPLLAGIALAAGVIWTSGFAAITAGYLNLMTFMFAVILLGLGIDFAIHIISGFTENRGKGFNIGESTKRTLTYVGPGVFTGAMTTAIAFLTICVSRTQGMKQFGLIVGMGVIFCMVASFIFLPPLLVLRERRLEKKGKTSGHSFSYEFKRMGSVADQFSRTRWIGLALGIILTGFLGYNASKWEFEYNMLEMEPKGMKSVEYHDKLLREFEVSPDTALVRATSVEEAREIAEQAKRYGNIAAVDSISEFLPRSDDRNEKVAIIRRIRSNLESQRSVRELTADDSEKLITELDRLWMNIVEMSSLAFQSGQDRLEQRCYELVADPDDPDSSDYIRSLIAEFSRDQERLIEAMNRFQKDYFDYFRQTLIAMSNTDEITVESLPENIRERYLSKNGEYYLVTISPKMTVWDYENLKNFNRQLKRISPRVTGTTLMSLSLIQYIKKDGQRSVVLAIIVVILLLFADFKRPLLVLLAIIPLIAGAVWMSGLARIVGTKINFTNIIALPLIIGIGIDDGVHLIHRYRIEGSDRIKTIFSSTGKAVLLTSLTTMVGFGSLIFMAHRGMASMGAVLVLGIGSCFLTTVFLLAPLFRIVRHKPK